MKKEIFQEIEIPNGVKAEIVKNILTIKGKEGEIKKKFNINKITFEKKDNKIIIGNKKATKNEKKMINTISAHIRNMIKGVQKKFEYKSMAVWSHFPITIELNNDSKEAIIKNFLGEKVPRKVKILENVNVEIGKPTNDNKLPITINSHDKELAGQTAANFEKATRIKSKDRRVFQDGIFIINKAGREI